MLTTSAPLFLATVSGTCVKNKYDDDDYYVMQIWDRIRPVPDSGAE